jgi:poly(hydroxyalkanoate) depolymerase family esterase
VLCGAASLSVVAAPAPAATTVEVARFGSNPGHLKMFKHIPDQLPATPPLVVVMHGCTQNARTFADESGWIALADRLRIALVMPEQLQANNQNKCFNWFQPASSTRDEGEALSIKQMVDKMTADHGVDPARVFATGLSAGGAMTSVMLAVYPEVFAGGGIVAGLPYGCAKTVTDALQCMNTGHASGGAGIMPLPPAWCLFFPLLCPADPSAGTMTAQQWGDLVRHASPHTGPFPRVSIWHGTADTTVSPVNATSEMEQWTNIHGIDPKKAAHDTVKGFARAVFKNAAGGAMVETYTVTGMAHGDPVDPGPAPDQCGKADQFVLDMNICSSLHIARFWGLAD